MKSAANNLIRTGNGKRVDIDQCLLTDLHEKHCQHLNQNWKWEKG